MFRQEDVFLNFSVTTEMMLHEFIWQVMTMIKNFSHENKEIIRITQHGVIKLIFPDKDNPKAVNTVLDNLLTTYEKRIYIEKESG